MYPLISVIVPVYNVENYLKKCIKSILNQTYKNLEIILVDDGSLDASGKICDCYAQKDSRIQTLHKTNGGLSDARNAGLELAAGEYLVFVDSDDWIDMDMIETLYQAALEHNAQITICGFREVDESGATISIEHGDNKCLSLSKEDAIKKLIEDKEIHNYVWNKLYKKEIFADIVFPYGKLMEDIWIMYRLFENAECIVQINMPKYNYLHRFNSIQRTRGLHTDWDQFCAYVEREHFLCEKYENLENILVNELCRFGIGIYQRHIKKQERSVTENGNKERIREILCQYQKKARKYCSYKFRMHIWLITHVSFIYQGIYRLRV